MRTDTFHRVKIKNIFAQNTKHKQGYSEKPQTNFCTLDEMKMGHKIHGVLALRRINIKLKGNWCKHSYHQTPSTLKEIKIVYTIENVDHYIPSSFKML